LKKGRLNIHTAFFYFSIAYLFSKLKTRFLINTKYLHNSFLKPNQYVVKKFNKKPCFYSIKSITK
jgi:hypothetical protein